MVMMVKCKSCRYEHDSGIQMDDESFKASTLSNNSEQCPRCGKTSTYNKEDYFFK